MQRPTGDRGCARQRQTDEQQDSPEDAIDGGQNLRIDFVNQRVSLSIEPVTTTAIRIIGDAGGIDQDARNGGERRYYTAISELAVYTD